jgi:hypothetical protein
MVEVGTSGRRRFARRHGGLALVAVLAAGSLAMSSLPATAMAKSRGKGKRSRGKSSRGENDLGPKVTPADAETKRSDVRAQVEALHTDDPANAGVTLDQAAAHWGDPALYLDAGDAYLEVASREQDLDYVDAARERARIALDILYFFQAGPPGRRVAHARQSRASLSHLDDTADPRFQLVAGPDIPGLIERANEMVDRADETQQAIEAALTEPDDDDPTDRTDRRSKTPGRTMIIGGAAAASVGGALLVMGLAGLGVGAARQREAQDPTVYGVDYDAVDAKGRRANAIAGVGLGIGVALAGAGAALLILGMRKKKAAAQGDTLAGVSPFLGRTGGGLAVRGRF